MFTFTNAKDIEWAYEDYETVEEATEAGKEYFGKDTLILIGEIDKDNNVTPIEEIRLSYSNAQKWGIIEHPELGDVQTYYAVGVPAYYSYTKPFIDNEGDICCYKYDHDEGCWADEVIVIGEYTGNKIVNFN